MSRMKLLKFSAHTCMGEHLELQRDPASTLPPQHPVAPFQSGPGNLWAPRDKHRTGMPHRSLFSGILWQNRPLKWKFLFFFFFSPKLFLIAELCFRRISQVEKTKKILMFLKRRLGFPTWLSAAQVFFELQKHCNNKGKRKTVIILYVLMFWKRVFLKVLCVSTTVLIWSIVKRANHCWHSSTEKSLDFIHCCTHYSSSKVHALKASLLHNSVKKNLFFVLFFCHCIFTEFRMWTSECDYRHELEQ